MAKKMFMNPFVLLSGTVGDDVGIGGASGTGTPDENLGPISLSTWLSYYQEADFMDYDFDGDRDKDDYDLWWAEMAEEDGRFTQEAYNDLNP